LPRGGGHCAALGTCPGGCAEIEPPAHTRQVAIARGVIAAVGLIDIAAALALLVVPEWFYTTVAEFPPFNRHYAGDAGAFLLGIGLALVLAARDPRRYVALLLIGVAVSWLHAINHLYDAFEHPGTGRAGVSDAGVIVAIAFALTVASVPFVSRSSGSTGQGVD
jgi:hypothetical protein